MYASNIAITVSPNIFRPREINPNELLSVAPLYDAMTKMIENYNLVFNQTMRFGSSETAADQEQHLLSFPATFN